MKTTAVVGFFTEESMELWFWGLESEVTVLRQKENAPKGDGSPHIIVEIEVENQSVLSGIYPEGMVLNVPFEDK